jgi:hypothetical protein
MGQAQGAQRAARNIRFAPRPVNSWSALFIVRFHPYGIILSI